VPSSRSRVARSRTHGRVSVSCRDLERVLAQRCELKPLESGLRVAAVGAPVTAPRHRASGSPREWTALRVGASRPRYTHPLT